MGLHHKCCESCFWLCHHPLCNLGPQFPCLHRGVVMSLLALTVSPQAQDIRAGKEGTSLSVICGGGPQRQRQAAEGSHWLQREGLWAEALRFRCAPPISATALLWTFGPPVCPLLSFNAFVSLYLVFSLENLKRECKLYRIDSKCGVYRSVNCESQGHCEHLSASTYGGCLICIVIRLQPDLRGS